MQYILSLTNFLNNSNSNHYVTSIFSQEAEGADDVYEATDRVLGAHLSAQPVPRRLQAGGNRQGNRDPGGQNPG